MMRSETRIQRYTRKSAHATKFRCSIAATEFQLDINVGVIVRAAACFGAQTVHIIGHVPPRDDLRSRSGSTSDFVEIVQHKTPADFLQNVKDSKLVAVELRENAKSIHDYKFDLTQDTVIIVGHETAGVPEGICNAADDLVYIPMPGIGFCLNTAMTAHIVLYEYVRQALREKNA
jgi:TrmH family RNA methyltransferase